MDLEYLPPVLCLFAVTLSAVSTTRRHKIPVGITEEYIAASRDTACALIVGKLVGGEAVGRGEVNAQQYSTFGREAWPDMK